MFAYILWHSLLVWFILVIKADSNTKVFNCSLCPHRWQCNDILLYFALYTQMLFIHKLAVRMHFRSDAVQSNSLYCTSKATYMVKIIFSIQFILMASALFRARFRVVRIFRYTKNLPFMSSHHRIICRTHHVFLVTR